MAEQLMSQKRRQSLRINSLSPLPLETIEERLAPYRDGLIPIAWCPGAYHMNLREGEMIDPELFAGGHLFIQNASSFMPVLALDPRPGQQIIDLCAAPGGKSSHIAALTGNKAQLWLNDGISSRLPKLKEVLGILHVKSGIISAHPAQHIDKFVTKTFDRILLDAQCTGEGMIDIRVRQSYRYWSLDRVHRYSMLQRKMLMAAHKLLKPGGVLVYSTCTFSPEENEIPVDHLLRHRKDMDVAPIELEIDNLTPARTSWQGSRLDPRLALARRVRPSEFMEGFFVCRLHKRPAES